MIERFVSVLNRVNTPWIAILVIALGMGFDIYCKSHNVVSESAAGVIGAGIGLLTGQALHQTDPTQPKA